MAGRPKHHLGAGCWTAECMRSGIVTAAICLDLGQPHRDRLAFDLRDKHLAKQIPGNQDDVTLKELSREATGVRVHGDMVARRSFALPDVMERRLNVIVVIAAELVLSVRRHLSS